MRWLVPIGLLILSCSGGGDGPGTGTSSGGPVADGGASSSGNVTTGGSSSGGSSSSGGTSSSSGGGTTGCSGTLTTLVKYGQTSECSHAVPVTYDPNMINVYFSPSPGVTEKLCQTSRTSCEQWKGWFFIGDEIAFCDETCSKIDSGEQAQFLVETGCPTEDCF